MNTLSMEWYGGWQINRWPRIGIVPIEKEQSRLWSEPKKVEVAANKLKDLKSHAKPGGQQLTLF